MELNEQVIEEIQNRLTKRVQDLFRRIDERLKPEVLVNGSDEVNFSKRAFTLNINAGQGFVSVALYFPGTDMMSYFQKNEAVPILPDMKNGWALIVWLSTRVYMDEARSYILEAFSKNIIKELRPLKEVDELLRSGGKYVMGGLSVYVNPDGAEHLYRICNEVSQMKYEKKVISGSILITKKDNLNIEYHLKFNEPFLLESIRKVRKVIELTKGEQCIISDSCWVYGLGTVKNTDQYPVYNITFEGDNKWKVSQDKKVLMVVENGIPNVYKEKINKTDLLQKLQNANNDLSETQKSNICEIVQQASSLKHGGLIVISDKAEDEAYRLKNESFGVEPFTLDKSLVEQVTSIDGAVLMDWDCNCYAIGVILDGIADENVGDSTRGARYNSAKRYCNYKGGKVLAIVISEDGMVNMDLPPRSVGRNKVVRSITFAARSRTDYEHIRGSPTPELHGIIQERDGGTCRNKS